jgi:hypothetical protein
MPNTYKKIASVVVGSGGVATIDFTSIPQTFTDLKIVLSGRATSTNPTLIIYFNNDTTTTNYSFRNINANGSTAASNSATQPWIGAGVNDSSLTASVFASSEIYIPNYTSANHKSFSADSVNENNGTTTNMALSSNMWSNTSAITRITLDPYGGDFAQYSTATLYGIGDVTASKFAKATGGLITYDSTYVYHTFTSSGIFTPNTTLTCDYLVIAGGGGGAANAGGGGGGGFRTGAGFSVNSQAYSITVGAGGAGSAATSGSKGNDSIFSTITSTGGGFGATAGAAGGSGGSGGGGGYGATTGGAGNTPSTSPSQGNNGGNGNNSTAPNYGGAGGGGAGAVGSNASNSTGGNGGNGASSSITGLSVTYAGGGGGGTYYGGTSGSGGSGGGGNAGAGSSSVTNAGIAGTANTGGGGGASSYGANGQTSLSGGNGGSGIVIIRYTR